MTLDLFNAGLVFPAATAAERLSSAAAAPDVSVLPVPDGSAYHVIVRGVANRQGAAGRALFARTLLVHASGGAAVIDNENDDGDFANGTTWTLTSTAVGGTIEFAFAGEAAATVDLQILVWVIPLAGGA